MTKRRIRWSKGLAYAIGLIATDGSLSKDGRHIVLVSKDIDQLTTFSSILKSKCRISPHSSSYSPTRKYFHIQIGNILLYRFLLKIGLTPNKTLTIGKLEIPQKYFIDFVRGHLDGDGNISFVSHKESRFYQLRLRFCSASLEHLQWINDSIREFFNISGGFISKPNKNVRYLTYGKKDAIQLLDLVYYFRVKYFLSRKRDYYLKRKGEW